MHSFKLLGALPWLRKKPSTNRLRPRCDQGGKAVEQPQVLCSGEVRCCIGIDAARRKQVEKPLTRPRGQPVSPPRAGSFIFLVCALSILHHRARKLVWSDSGHSGVNVSPIKSKLFPHRSFRQFSALLIMPFVFIWLRELLGCVY